MGIEPAALEFADSANHKTTATGDGEREPLDLQTSARTTRPPPLERERGRERCLLSNVFGNSLWPSVSASTGADIEYLQYNHIQILIYMRLTNTLKSFSHIFMKHMFRHTKRIVSTRCFLYIFSEHCWISFNISAMHNYARKN